MNTFLLRSHSTRHHSTRAEHTSGTPGDSPLPPRPKSTLGFSSRFAQTWMASIASSTRSSTRSSPVKDAIPSPDRTSLRGRPSTPLSFGRRRHREPALAPPAPLTPIQAPHIFTPARRPVAPRKPETPRTKAIHIEWRIAARQLEGDWKDCLMGAECLEVFDPLDGVKAEMVKIYSPKRATSHLVIDTIPVKSSFTYQSLPHRWSISPTPPSSTVYKPSTLVQSASPTPISRRPLATRRTINPNPIPLALQAGITPRSARRIRHRLRMTPMAPLKPVCYVPLKSPAPSPRVSRDGRQVPTPSPGSSKASAIGAQEVIGAEMDVKRYQDEEELDCSILLGGAITPPSFDDSETSALSPWHVVRPTSPMSDDDGVSEWIVTSPVRPHSDRIQAARRWRL